jgi:hypothetical protein
MTAAAQEPDWELLPGLESTPNDVQDPTTELDVVEGPVLVDQDTGPVEAPKETRRNVLPSWAHSPKQLADATLFWVAHYWHLTRFHAVRLPVYWWRLAARSPIGIFRLTRWFGVWLFDLEGRPLRRTMSGHGPGSSDMDAPAYLRLSTLHDTHIRNRSIGTLAALLLVVILIRVGHPTTTTTGTLIALLFILAVLGLVGRSPDRPVMSRAVDRKDAPHLTSDMIIRALAGLGIAELNKALRKGGDGVGFPAPITRDGKGFRADVDLPLGVTAGDIMERREKLASGLRRPAGCVWPEPAHDEHAGRLILWVGDQPISKTKQPAWSLLKRGSVDLFKPFQFGTDQRGRWVEITLMFASVVIGALPRMGKTFSMRLMLLAAALDPRAEIHAYDLKGTGDLSPLEAVAHRYRCGDDDEDIEYAVADMRAVKEEMRRRTKVIRELPHNICPDSKVTPELSSQKSLGLHPIVLGIDECFPAGTLVGGRPIESLQVGESVPSWDEQTGQPCLRPVEHLFRSVPSALVRVRLADGDSIVCTPNHPIMTARGWVRAGVLLPTDGVLSYGATTVRPISSSRSGAGEVLQLRSGGHDHPVLPCLPVEKGRSVLLLAGVPGSDLEGTVQADVRRAPRADGSAHAGGQPHARPRNPAETEGVTEADQPSTAGEGWERGGADRASGAAGQRSGMAYRSRGEDGGQAESGHAVSLQAGRRSHPAEGSGGDRRRVALCARQAGPGQAQGRLATWRRVDRVEVLERGRDGRFGGLCPDGHVYNIEVAGTHTYQVGDGVVVHNCQLWFEHPTHGKELEAIITDLAKRGPALGIITMLATQRPDKESLPTRISSMAAIRFCLKVMGQVENDMVLGTSSYRNGIRATMLTRRDLGIGFLAGEGDDAVIVRTVLIDAPAAAALAKRARAARIAAGLLTGHAAGQTPEPDTNDTTLLHDLLEVIPASEPKVWGEVAAERLATHRPARYAGWSTEQLTTALKPHNITTVQISGLTDGRRVNRRGIIRRDLEIRLRDMEEGPSEPDFIV